MSPRDPEEPKRGPGAPPPWATDSPESKPVGYPAPGHDGNTSDHAASAPPPAATPTATAPPPPGSVWGPPPGHAGPGPSGPAASADLAPPPPPGSIWGADPSGSAGIPLGTALSTALAVLFWVAAGAAALSAVLYLLVVTRLGAFREEYDRYLEGLASLVRLDDAAGGVNTALTAAGLAYMLFLATLLALAVTMIIWTAKAHRASMSMHPGQRSWGPAWAIGGWFIPVANLVIPKLVLDETERIARAPRTDRHVDADWRNGSVSSLGWCWWILWIVGGVLSLVGMFAWFAGLADEPFDRYLVYDASDDLRQVQLGYILFAVSLAVYAASLAAGAIYVRTISRLLAAPLFSGEPHASASESFSPGDPFR